jgi:hypothetical protein
MTLLDSSQFRAWPPRGGQAMESDLDADGPVQAHEISVPGLVSSIVDTIDENTKTAAVEQGLSAQNIWRHPDAHPLVLALMLLDKYGPEYIDWHPDVLKLTLERDKIQVSNSAWTKVLAGRVALNSPSPWRQWEVFHWLCRALNGMTPNFTYFEKPEIGHLVSGFETMKACDPKRPTGFAIDKFVATVFQDEGIAFVPPPLDFCTRELEGRQLECTSCGAKHRDDNDTKCISCGSSSLKKLPYAFEDLKVECAKLWAAAAKKPLAQAVADLPDSSAGNAVYRLLIEWDYAKDMKSRLIQQLKMIGGR